MGSKENLSEGRKAQARIYLPALPPLKYMVSVSPCKFSVSLGSEDDYLASQLFFLTIVIFSSEKFI